MPKWDHNKLVRVEPMILGFLGDRRQFLSKERIWQVMALLKVMGRQISKESPCKSPLRSLVFKRYYSRGIIQGYYPSGWAAQLVNN